MSAGTHTTNGTTLNLKTLKEAIDLIYKLDPIAAYMRDAGFDPQEGCIMVVPKKLWEDEGFPDRSFVKKSEFVQQIILFRQPLFDKLSFDKPAKVATKSGCHMPGCEIECQGGPDFDNDPTAGD